MKNVNFNILSGKTLVSVTTLREKNRICFETNNGEKYIMFHVPECSEDVYIEDICGDLKGLIGSPILVAEESSNVGETQNEDSCNCTWTFYKLATIREAVTIRWYGTSNGFYSETAGLYEIETFND